MAFLKSSLTTNKKNLCLKQGRFSLLIAPKNHLSQDVRSAKNNCKDTILYWCNEDISINYLFMMTSFMISIFSFLEYESKKRKE